MHAYGNISKALALGASAGEIMLYGVVCSLSHQWRGGGTGQLVQRQILQRHFKQLPE